ncbi:transmembrane protein 263-B-like [Liolophura sinensis]|uniref:transmembrane protein 263-B-like n=1 Tax=Liolophura sinensis TaxID=3198878 RepID=UPI0031587BE1
MTSWYQSVKSYIVKPPPPPKEEMSEADDVKENDAPEISANKKTDEAHDPSQQPGILWRMSSGVYNTASGAVGMGVGGVKWAAGKGYDVVSKVPVPSVPRLRRKDKNE